jgi:hypothetical protein
MSLARDIEYVELYTNDEKSAQHVVAVPRHPHRIGRGMGTDLHRHRVPDCQWNFVIWAAAV